MVFRISHFSPCIKCTLCMCILCTPLCMLGRGVGKVLERCWRGACLPACMHAPADLSAQRQQLLTEITIRICRFGRKVLERCRKGAGEVPACLHACRHARFLISNGFFSIFTCIKCINCACTMQNCVCACVHAGSRCWKGAGEVLACLPACMPLQTWVLRDSNF